MRLHLLFALGVFYCRCTFLITAYSTSHSNRDDNSAITIDLYHCNSNTTISNVTTTVIDAGFGSLTKSCGIHCCLNHTISSNLCQVTVHSIAGICLGHLCYSNECERFMSLINPNSDHPTKNKTTLINQLHSTFSSLTWSSFINKTQTKFNAWFDQSDTNIRHTVIVILFIVNIFLTFIALLFVIISIRRANIVAEERPYHYTLL